MVKICRYLALCLMPVLLQPGSAAAQCSRALNAPVSPMGLSVTTAGGVVGGIYPELLRALAGKTGCSVNFTIVPRARQEALFVSGQADIFVSARRTPKRDDHGEFVALIHNRPLLISFPSNRVAVRSLPELMERRELRVVVVRGFDYGDRYQLMVKELEAQGRLLTAVDPLSVARMLDRGIADVTVMSPLLLVGSLLQDTGLKPMASQLRLEALEELPWGETGLYIPHKSSLPESDRALFKDLLEQVIRSGAVWKAYQKYYPEQSLKLAVRPR